MMTKKEKISYIQTKLDEIYPTVPIPLDHHDAYTLLIAVLLSAQCTDKRVNIITPDLFDRADTPQKMAQVPLEEIETLIKTCGLYRNKSKAILKLSQMLINDFEGKVPDNFKDLESLPGVGHKTASVVMSQAFGVPAFPVDTHIHRLATRWKLTSGKNVVQTEKDLKRLFPEDTWNKLHLQIIYYGREYCPARGHDVDACPICHRLTKK